MGYDDKRQRVLDYVESLRAGSTSLHKVPYNDKIAVCVEALAQGVIQVNDISPKLCKAVADAFLKNAPWRERDTAGDTGTEVHDWAEQLVLGVITFDQVPGYLNNHVLSLRQFWADYDLKFEATEFTVYSRQHGYAGTGDFLARSRKFPEYGLILGDYKTSKSGIWPDIALQLAAIRFADFIGLPDDTEEPIPQIDTCMGVQITEEGYSVVPVRADETTFIYFLRALDVSRWTTEANKTVLGEAQTSLEITPA